MSHESSRVLLRPTGYTTGMENFVLPIIVPLLSKCTERVHGELPFPITRHSEWVFSSRSHRRGFCNKQAGLRIMPALLFDIKQDDLHSKSYKFLFSITRIPAVSSFL